jgi:hypothetical protein
VPPGYDTVPLGIFWMLFIVWLLPWCAFLPQALGGFSFRWNEIRRGLGAALDRQKRAHLLFLLWAIVILGFFSFSTRQEYYNIPAVPAMALVIGNWLMREADSSKPRPTRPSGQIASAVLCVIGVLAFLAGLYLLSLSHRPAEGADLADLLKKNPEEYNLSLGHMLDLTPQALGLFRGPLLGFSLALFLGTFLNWMLRRSGRPMAGNAALAAMMIVLLASIHAAFSTFSPILSSFRLAEAIGKRYRPGDVIVIDGQYSDASTLNFYTGIEVHVLGEPAGNLWHGAKFPDAPHLFETQESLATLWRGPETVFVWTDQDEPKELAGLKFFSLARSGGKSIFTNRDLTH